MKSKLVQIAMLLLMTPTKVLNLTIMMILIRKMVDSTSPKAKAQAWRRGTCLVTGDSILSYIDETCMSSKFNVKVRSFPGAKTDDIFYYLLVPLLKKIQIMSFFMLVLSMPSTTNQTKLFQKYLN